MILISILVILTTINVFGQNYGSVMFGVSKNLSYTNGEMGQVGNIIDCDTYFANDGNSFQFNLEYRYNIYKDFYIKPGVFYSGNQILNFNRKDKFFSRNDITLFVNEVNTESNLDINSSYFSPSLNVLYKLFSVEKSSVYLSVGGFYRVYNKSSFAQYEDIVSPANASFINYDYKQHREISSGTTNFINNQFFISTGVNYEYTFRYFNLYAGINYSLSPSSLIVKNDIGVNELAFNIGVSYDIEASKEKTEIIKEEPKKVEIIKPIEEIVVKDSLNFELINSQNSNYKVKDKEELLASIPLVNSIFFYHNTSEIPDNYFLSKNIDNIVFKDILDAHNYVIPRIVKILENNPNSKITLKSYLLTAYKNDSITKARGENVKNTFIDLGITADRIKIENEINKSTNFSSEDLIKEFYRVDINLENAQFQEYVKASKYRELTGELNFNIYSNVDKYVNLKIKDLDIDTNHLSIGEHKLSFSKKFYDTKKIKLVTELETNSLEKSFNFDIDLSEIEVVKGDLDVSSFEAILRFDFNSSKLSEENKELLRQLYALIPEHTTIEILGSSDATGSEQINLQLEEERAKNTKSFIESLNKKNLEIKTARAEKKFTNDTPQGRFLNRSIIIKLKK